MKKTSAKVFCFILILLTALLSSCEKSSKIRVSIAQDWKYSFDDREEFKEVDYDDSSWQTQKELRIFHVPDNRHYFWVRKVVDVPQELTRDTLWLNYGKSNSAAAIYANGILVGYRGSFPPNVNIRTEKQEDFLIPDNCIVDGKVSLAIRVYCAGTYVEGLNFSLDNRAGAYFVNEVSHIFDQKMFLVICFICLFFFFYSLAEFVQNKDCKEFLFFSLGLLFISIYFYDLGADTLLLPYNFNRAFTRSCLPIAMNFLLLFFNTFFKRPKTKQMLIGVVAYDVISASICLLFCRGNDEAVSTFFLINLVTVLVCVVYGMRVSIIGLKQKLFGAPQIIVALVVASLLAIHDVVFQAMGRTPVIWLQGFAFFLIELALFITVFQRSSAANKQVVVLAKTTNAQKEKLESVFAKARDMAEDSVSVATSLSDSVTAVADAAESSKAKVQEINQALDVQTKIREETQVRVEELAKFLVNMTQEFENELQMINKTAEGTKAVIEGIQSVGEGIKTAANFTNSLSSLTSSGSADMKKLMEVMLEVQKSSNEILGVVTTLDDFAHQTDLLSMNASIEAAHSGAAGKGFAVIAHEIKDLAAKTSQWSSRIGEIITTVINQIKKSVDLCQKVDNSLVKINEGASESAEKVGNAARGIEQQQEAGEIISRESISLVDSAKTMDQSIKSQSKFASDVMENMEKLQKASQDVNEASAQIKESSASLASQAQELMQIVNRTNSSAKDLKSLMDE